MCVNPAEILSLKPHVTLRDYIKPNQLEITSLKFIRAFLNIQIYVLHPADIKGFNIITSKYINQ